MNVIGRYSKLFCIMRCKTILNTYLLLILLRKKITLKGCLNAFRTPIEQKRNIT